jgi:hypothetical protein
VLQSSPEQPQSSWPTMIWYSIWLGVNNLESNGSSFHSYVTMQDYKYTTYWNWYSVGNFMNSLCDWQFPQIITKAVFTKTTFQVTEGFPVQCSFIMNSLSWQNVLCQWKTVCHAFLTIIFSYHQKHFHSNFP